MVRREGKVAVDRHQLEVVGMRADAGRGVSRPLPIWPFTAAIFESASHPNAAKLFLDWYLSPELQAKMGTWSPRSDVPAPNGWKPILAYNVVNSYREFLTNTKQLEELRKRFEAYTGPVKNVGGVR